jgi:D-beta-D-heptose 7-phosphate kinase/D-beta-D-heptose 1-phosphate adenosyltransferase
MVLADGCFDPLHYGHIRYLSVAATFGELIVRVAPDDEVLAKGRLLYQSREERLRTVGALRMVEDVCDDATLAEAITRLKPKYLAKGDDWRVKGLPADVEVALKLAGTCVIFTQTQERTSTERLQA